MVAPVPLIQNVDARQATSLNGAWHIIVDPYDVGYRTYHGQPQILVCIRALARSDPRSS
jgi:hypothetical protein